MEPVSRTLRLLNLRIENDVLICRKSTNHPERITIPGSQLPLAFSWCLQMTLKYGAASKARKMYKIFKRILTGSEFGQTHGLRPIAKFALLRTFINSFTP